MKKKKEKKKGMYGGSRIKKINEYAKKYREWLVK